MIVFGEILRSHPPSSEYNLNKLRYEYQVRCVVGGSYLIFNNAMLLEPISGIDNFHEVVLRSSLDGGGGGSALYSNTREGDFRPGDRVLIAFVDGEFSSPVIIGTLPHPTFEPISNLEQDRLVSLPILAEQQDPQIRGRYNGFNYRIDEVGQVRLQHSGAPTIKIESGLFVEAEDEDYSSITTLDFLKKGDFRLVDSNRQALVIDAQKKYISINNTTTFPDENYEAILGIEIAEPGDDEVPQGQEIRLDQANENLSILTSGTHKLIVGTDQLIKIFGDSDSTISENETRVIGADFKETIGKGSTIDIGKSLITNVKENIGFISEAGNSIFLDSSPGKEAIFIAHRSGAQIVIDKDGSIKMVAQDGTYMFLNANTGEFTATTKTGAMISAKDNVVISDSDGTELITLKKGAIEISADTSVTVSATNVTLNGGSVALGAGSTMSGVLGEPLIAWLTSHAHLTAVGLSGPSVIPPPPTILSQSVKLKP